MQARRAVFGVVSSWAVSNSSIALSRYVQGSSMSARTIQSGRPMVREVTPAARNVSPIERQIIARLLNASFKGADALCAQMSQAAVRSNDYGGVLVLAFEVAKDAVPAEVSGRIPVEAQARDSDGVMIHMLLHVVDGFLREVEIFREDSQPIHQLPQISEVNVQMN